MKAQVRLLPRQWALRLALDGDLVPAGSSIIFWSFKISV